MGECDTTGPELSCNFARHCGRRRSLRQIGCQQCLPRSCLKGAGWAWMVPNTTRMMGQTCFRLPSLNLRLACRLLQQRSSDACFNLYIWVHPAEPFFLWYSCSSKPLALRYIDLSTTLQGSARTEVEQTVPTALVSERFHCVFHGHQNRTAGPPGTVAQGLIRICCHPSQSAAPWPILHAFRYPYSLRLSVDATDDLCCMVETNIYYTFAFRAGNLLPRDCTESRTSALHVAFDF